LRSLGLPPDERCVKLVLEQVRRHAVATKRAINSDELREFYSTARTMLAQTNSSAGKAAPAGQT